VAPGAPGTSWHDPRYGLNGQRQHDPASPADAHREAERRIRGDPLGDLPAFWYSPVKVRDILRLLMQDGWYQVASKGSHRQFTHPTKPGRVTISGHPNDVMPRGTLASVRRQAPLGQEGR